MGVAGCDVFWPPQDANLIQEASASSTAGGLLAVPRSNRQRGPSPAFRHFACTQVVYSQFLDAVKGGHVRAVRFDDAAKRVYFDLQPQPAPPSEFCQWSDVRLC